MFQIWLLGHLDLQFFIVFSIIVVVRIVTVQTDVKGAQASFLKLLTFLMRVSLDRSFTALEVSFILLFLGRIDYR